MWRLVAASLLIASSALAADPRAQARKVEIDRLLDLLKQAPTEEAAGLLEGRIKQLWLAGGSPASLLLMNRGDRDLQANAGDEAVADFDAVLALDPEFADAYEHRAVARFQDGDFPGAVADIEETLRREPRHFAAFQVLSRIAEARGDWAGALAAWQKALDIDPRTPEGQERLQKLRLKVEGEPT